MSDGNRDADAEGMWCCGGLRSHAFDCKMRNVAPPGSPTNDLSTLLAELDAHWNAVGPLHLEATDEGVDIADAGLRCLAEVPDRLGVTPQERDGIVALVNAYPALREAIEQLQQQLETSRMSEVEQAKRRGELGLEVVKLRRECDEARARAIRWNNEHATAEDRWVEERDALRAEVLQLRKNLLRTWAAAEVREYDLRKLVAQQREALQSISEHLPCDLPCKMKPAQGKCGECGAYKFETWCAGCVARAVLAAEVPHDSM